MSADVSKPPQSGSVYVCPMHADVRRPRAGKCPQCGMDLLPEGTRFALLRHMIKSPIMLMIMLAAIIAVMAAVMMVR